MDTVDQTKRIVGFAVVRRWKDNPNDVEVVEYADTYEQAQAYISKQGKSPLFHWEIGAWQ